MPEIKKSHIWNTYDQLDLVRKNADQLTEIIRFHADRRVLESRVMCAAAEMALAVRYCRDNHLF